MCWLLTRSFAVLGGSIAGTAVAWAIASGTAAAEPVSVDELGIEPATAAVGVLQGTVNRVAETLPGTERAARAFDAVKSAEPLRVPLAHRPMSLGLPQHSESELPAAQPEQEAADTAQQASDDARVLDVGKEVVSTDDVPAPDGASNARSPRTASGPDGPFDGTGDAPAHAPAPVPPMPAPPAAAASGCPAGSSLLPAFMGQHLAGDAVTGMQAVVVSAADCGRPNTAGAQPGTVPD